MGIPAYDGADRLRFATRSSHAFHPRAYRNPHEGLDCSTNTCSHEATGCDGFPDGPAYASASFSDAFRGSTFPASSFPRWFLNRRELDRAGGGNSYRCRVVPGPEVATLGSVVHGWPAMAGADSARGIGTPRAPGCLLATPGRGAPALRRREGPSGLYPGPVRDRPRRPGRAIDSGGVLRRGRGDLCDRARWFHADGSPPDGSEGVLGGGAALCLPGAVGAHGGFLPSGGIRRVGAQHVASGGSGDWSF